VCFFHHSTDEFWIHHIAVVALYLAATELKVLEEVLVFCGLTGRSREEDEVSGTVRDLDEMPKLVQFLTKSPRVATADSKGCSETKPSSPRNE